MTPDSSFVRDLRRIDDKLRVSWDKRCGLWQIMRVQTKARHEGAWNDMDLFYVMRDEARVWWVPLYDGPDARPLDNRAMADLFAGDHWSFGGTDGFERDRQVKQSIQSSLIRKARKSKLNDASREVWSRQFKHLADDFGRPLFHDGYAVGPENIPHFVGTRARRWDLSMFKVSRLDHDRRLRKWSFLGMPHWVSA